jgi:hypothetical protein
VDGAQVHRGVEPVAQFGQGGIRLGRDQDEQAEVAFAIHLGGLGAAAGLGGERAGFAPALEQASDPGGADAEPVGDLAAGATALVTGADDPLAEVL